MKIAFRAKVEKIAGNRQASEDRYRVNKGRTIVALSDGASESYNSRIWAGILCQLVVSDKIPDHSMVLKAIDQYHQYDKHAPENLSWSQEGAFKRGSFATLLAIKHTTDKQTCHVFAAGDSVVVFCDDRNPVKRFPLAKAEEFDANPELLSTRDGDNDFLDSPSFKKNHWLSQPVSNNTIALLMTDALGQWCYRSIEEERDEWHFLLDVTDKTEFRSFVLKARAEKRMKIDDTTLIRLSFANEISAS